MTNINKHYKSLEDYLISNILHVDGKLDDGWGEPFVVKGREIEATALHCDLSNFSQKTLQLSSTEILIFLNNVFCWMTAEALKKTNGIITQYIGDEMRMIFSKEFGSKDPFKEAIETARWMSEWDELGFCPHIGIASGIITVGYIGTHKKYECSAVGTPLTLASRCTSVKPQDQTYSSSIIILSEEWGNKNIEDIITPVVFDKKESPSTWKILEPRKVEFKNIGSYEIREIVNTIIRFSLSHPDGNFLEERAKESLNWLKENGFYKKFNI